MLISGYDEFVGNKDLFEYENKILKIKCEKNI